jgi:hypothetical protein
LDGVVPCSDVDVSSFDFHTGFAGEEFEEIIDGKIVR